MCRLFRLEAAGRTDPGRKRSKNEDRFAAAEGLGLFLVTDGLGAPPAGDFAAVMAIETVVELTEAALPFPPHSPDAAMRRFADSVRAANQRIRLVASQDRQKRGMATTFAGVLAHGAVACVAHVGNSRVYRLRAGSLQRLTEDHTYRTQALRAGVPADVIEEICFKDALERTLGSHDTVSVETRIEDILADDVMLVCTDGLYGLVPDDDIVAIIARHERLGDAVDHLIACANENGGTDNVACVLARWTA